MSTQTGMGTTLLLIALCGCSTSAPSTNHLAGAGRAPTAICAPPGSNTAHFGETLTLTNGVTVQVSPPATYNPSRYAFADDVAGTPVRFEITVTNRTNEPIKADVFGATTQSGSIAGSEIIDTTSAMNGTLTTPLGQDGSATYSMGFYVSDPDNLALKWIYGEDTSVCFTPN